MDAVQSVAGAAGTDAWWQRPFRMVQTNLRLTDAALDPKRLARQTKEFGANILLFNIGGIYAWYPTDLPLHAKNPFLKGDILREILDAAHAEGIKLIGRFDMSKATETAYKAHPDWFIHNIRGEPLVYNGTYQACVNSGWYQGYAHDILREALGRYEVDGLFFNMFGYRSTNYSGEYHGICVCDHCRKRFREMYGRELPEQENFKDPSYRDYIEFKDRTSLELADDIYKTIKATRPEVVVTGRRQTCDVIRMEVQRAVDRPQPEWAYQAGEQARWASAYGRGKVFASTSTNFLDFAWRYVSETGAYHVLRFAQQLASGAALDYYLLGTFDQEDKKPFPAIEALYKWHAKNEAHYVGLKPAARIGLWYSQANADFGGATKTGKIGNACFRGAYRMLAEARLPFDFISDERAEDSDFSDTLNRYDAIFLANISCLGDTAAAALDAWVERGGTLIATGETGAYDHRGTARDTLALASLPVSKITDAKNAMRGAYFRVAPGEVDFSPTELMYLDGWYFEASAKAGAERRLTLLPTQRFGPPELCYLEGETTLPGVFIGKHGKGTAVYIPWLPEWHYYRDSVPDEREFVVDFIRRHAPKPMVALAGTGPVEVTVQEQPSTGRLLIHLVNFAGQRNNLYEDPAELHGLRLGIREEVKGSLRALVAEKDLAPAGKADADGYRWVDLPPLGSFEAISVSRG